VKETVEAPKQARLDDAFFRALAKTGYAVQPGALSRGEVESLSWLVDQVSEAERRDGTAWFSHGNQRIFNLINKGVRFLGLIDHPLAMQLTEHCLGPHCLLSSMTANIARPSNSQQQLHADQGYLPEPWLRSEVVNIIYALDEFTDENGATRVVPGSHQIGSAPPSQDPPTEPILAPSGALICLDGRVWHGTGRNATHTHMRRAIFAYYCRPYIRQQENFSRSLHAPLLQALTPVQSRLLGLHIWLGLGSVNGLPTTWMDGRPRIGPADLVERK
jgi:hypothetical protein